MGSTFYDDHHHGDPRSSHSHGQGGHGHAHSHSRLGRWAYVAYCAAVGVLLLLYVLGVARSFLGIDLALLLALVAGFPLLQHALADVLRGHFSSHLTIAIAAVAAVAVGEYFAAAEVMFIMLVGEGLEHWTVDRAKGAIAGFVQSQPKLARVRRDGTEVELDPAEVEIDETVIVRAGELIPVDGAVRTGESTVDQSRITGEPMPAPKRAGDAVYSGSVNEYGVLEIRAERVGGDTTLARIATLIREAQERRAPIVRVADRLARYFLPAVLLASGLIYLVTGEMLRTVAALIVACPCALVLATPAAVASAIARLAREGVLIKGGEVIESLAHLTAVTFDKTGTLTAGRPTVSGVVAAPGRSEAEVLALAAAAESSSEHLLGRAIVEAARERGLEVAAAEDFVLRPGLGVEARVAGERVRVGNLVHTGEGVEAESLAWAERSLSERAEEGETRVVVREGDRVIGLVALRDPLRPGAAAAVAELAALGIEPISMLTGDAEATARSIGRRAGINDIHAGLLPEEKVHKVRELRRSGAKVLMVGDGVNDAPSLASADVGLAMGRGAADISAEAAQVVFLKDELTAIPSLIAYARKTIGRIRSSILLFAFGINFGAVGLAAFGWLSPALAAIVHQGASLAVILNSVRLLVEGKAVEEKQAGRLALLRHRLGHRLHGLQHVRHRVEHLLGDVPAALRARRSPLLRLASAVAAALWLVSGLTAIRSDEVGLVQRFGRFVEPYLEPGLHLRLPWPMERVARLQARRVRTIEIGFRNDEDGGSASVTASSSDGNGSEPLAYEWNTRHTSGPFRQLVEESLMLTGDENLVEAYGVVQFAVADPARYLFAVREPERLLRATAEQTLRATVGRTALDAILTGARREMEATWQRELEAALARYQSGIAVLAVHLKDAHPPLDVVDAFRDVSSALEERETRINNAEGYLKEQLPLSRGEAEARLLGAQSYSARRVSRGSGESEAFTARAGAYGEAPAVTAFRLYVETMEEVLPGRRKFITDGRPGGRRRFLFYEASANGDAPVTPLTLVEPPREEPPREQR